MERARFLYLLLAISCLGVVVKSSRSQINSTEKTLSRRKRYLVFPEGSSLQLVYCLTMPVIGRSTIFTIGGTAALAWELPSEPYRHIHKQKEAEKKVDLGIQTDPAWKYKKVANTPVYLNSYSVSSPGHFYKTAPSGGGPQYSPAYAQMIKRRRIYSDLKFHSEPIAAYAHPIYHYAHRRTRRDLYAKIEKFFTAQSKDGRACLLKSVCEVSQAALGKGTFMQEIVKAIFRVKPYEGYTDEDEYDKAADRRHNCTDMYPTCAASVWNLL